MAAGTVVAPSADLGPDGPVRVRGAHPLRGGQGEQREHRRGREADQHQPGDREPSRRGQRDQRRPGHHAGDAGSEHPVGADPVGNHPGEQPPDEQARPEAGDRHPGVVLGHPPALGQQQVGPQRGRHLDRHLHQERRRAQPQAGQRPGPPAGQPRRGHPLGRRVGPGPRGDHKGQRQQGLHRRERAVAGAPAQPGGDRPGHHQRAHGGTGAETGVQPVDVPGTEVPGHVRVQAGVDRAAAGTEEQCGRDHEGQSGRQRVPDQGGDGQPGAAGQQPSHAEPPDREAGRDAGEHRAGGTGDEKEPDRADRHLEVGPQVWPGYAVCSAVQTHTDEAQVGQQQQPAA
jgi:hypothetical protein